MQDTAGNTRWQVDASGNTWQPGNVTAGSGNFNAYLATNGQMSSNTVYTNGLTVAGQSNLNSVAANYLSLAAGATLAIGGGGSTFFGDGYNTAARQNGGFYVQDPSGNTRLWVDPGGNSTQIGSNTVNATYLTAVVGAGNGCSPNGLQAQDGSGAILSCQNGVWTYPGSVPSGTTCGLSTNNGTTGYPCMGYNATYGCPPGYGQMFWRVNFGNDAVYYCFKI